MFHRFIRFNLTSQHEEILRKTIINEDGPGTILRDFDALLSYVGEKKLQVTKGYNLRLRDVRQINDRFTRPLQLGLTRPQQKSYPHLHGLYLLLRSSGLTYIDDTGKNPYLYINDSMYQVWRALNPTERYMNLLETWLIYADPKLIGEKTGMYSGVGGLSPWVGLFRDLTQNRWQSGDEKEIETTIRYFIGDFNLGILDAFGLVKAEFGPPKPKTSWYLESLQDTPFGGSLLSLISTKLGEETEEEFEEEEDNDVLNRLQPILQPYFPEWEDSLTILEPEEPFIEGTHVFKVSLGNIWRRLAVPAELDLDMFASTILQSVEFDRDHLYSFTYRNRFGIQHDFNHPYMEEGNAADEFEIGDLSLYAGQTMTFLFDFGDKWKFKIVLERIDTTMEIGQPVLLESHGDAPEQYPSWDEEWEEEDEEV